MPEPSGGRPACQNLHGGGGGAVVPEPRDWDDRTGGIRVEDTETKWAHSPPIDYIIYITHSKLASEGGGRDKLGRPARLNWQQQGTLVSLVCPNEQAQPACLAARSEIQLVTSAQG